MITASSTASRQAQQPTRLGHISPARGVVLTSAQAHDIDARTRHNVRANAPETIVAPDTRTDVVTDVRPVTDDGDHDRFAHYTRRADANRAYIEGTPLRALCGKVWVPSRDPSRYPVCPECEKIRQQLRNRIHN